MSSSAVGSSSSGHQTSFEAAEARKDKARDKVQAQYIEDVKKKKQPPLPIWIRSHLVEGGFLNPKEHSYDQERLAYRTSLVSYYKNEGATDQQLSDGLKQWGFDTKKKKKSTKFPDFSTKDARDSYRDKLSKEEKYAFVKAAHALQKEQPKVSLKEIYESVYRSFLK